jgi:cytochrome c-type biogenesis protein CcmH
MIWIVLAVMALAAVAFITLPLIGSRRAIETPRAAHDVALFRDQLAELEREHADGEIGDAEAVAARREIERRLLAAGRALGAAPKNEVRNAGRAPRLRLAAVLAALVVPAAFLIYLDIGTPEAPAFLNMVAQVRAEDAQRRAELSHLVGLVEERLAEAPDDGQGWGLLASAKLRLGKMDDARNALAKAKQFLPAPQAAEMTARFAQTLADVSEGQAVSPVVRYASEALDLDADNGRARMLLAIMAMQTGDTDGARAQWSEIVKRLPADSPFYAQAKTALDRLDKGQAPTAPAGQ